MSDRVITDPDVQMLAAIATNLRDDYRDDDSAWEGSPFAWVKTRPSRQVGKIFEQLIAGWCAAKDLNVSRSPDSECDRVIEGLRVEIKGSTLWKAGGFKFQQLRDQRYDVAVCLGISPFDAHCWTIPKEVIAAQPEGVTPQHGGQAGTDTLWLAVDPDEIPAWMNEWGGRLKDAYSVLVEIANGGVR